MPCDSSPASDSATFFSSVGTPHVSKDARRVQIATAGRLSSTQSRGTSTLVTRRARPVDVMEKA